MFAIGSRGDVQPFIALALEMKRQGIAPIIASHPDFEEFISSYGIEYAPVRVDSRQLMETMSPVGTNLTKYYSAICELIDEFGETYFNDFVSACKGADAILYVTFGGLAYHIAEAMGIPVFRVFFYPMTATGDFSLIDHVSMGSRFLNKASYWATERMFLLFTKRKINVYRARLGLRPITGGQYPYESMRGKRVPVLYAFSPSIVPPPREWGDHIYITGYWFLEEPGYDPPGDLLSFLHGGDMPFYVGFGSIVEPDCRERLGSIIAEAAVRTGKRLIVCGGWNSLKLPSKVDGVFQTDSIPHDWLFQRVAGVVHHGGCGTTAAGLLAGKPTFIVHFVGDQPFWGMRVYNDGLGPKTCYYKRLTAEKLSKAIETMSGDAMMSAKANAMGLRLREERGSEQAVQAILAEMEKPYHER